MTNLVPSCFAESQGRAQGPSGASPGDGLEAGEADAAERLNTTLAALPNLPAADVPAGEDESGNVVVHQRGTPPSFAFTAREHDAIGPGIGLDFETGVAIAGARFTLVRGPAARIRSAMLS